MLRLKICASSLLTPRLNSIDVLKRLVMKQVIVPEPGKGEKFRRIVHFEDEYTVKPLNVTNLGGRDPETGRLVVKGLGGGIKHKYHWVDFARDGPTEGHICEEVLEILEDGCRTAHIALVAVGDKLKYIIASENMKVGDILKTSRHIPRIPVRANEGDAYPLGALPVGTIVHCVQLQPDFNFHFATAAGTYAVIMRNIGSRVIVKIPSKIEVALKRECMATVGRVSNILHSETPIGSPNRLRELGYRSRSGLWQRKTGRFGRKIRAPPPVQLIEEKEEEREKLQLTLDFNYYDRYCV